MNKALVFGSVNVDHTYEVESIVRPGETVSSVRYRTAWGGKGLNQAVALAKAGAEVSLAAQVAAAERLGLLALCDGLGLKTGAVRAVNAPTGHAIIQVDKNGQNCIIVEAGANGTIEDETIARAFEGFGAGDVLLLQNEINRLDEIIGKAKEKGIQVALNPSPCNEKILRLPLGKVDLFILNEVEGGVLSGESDPESILSSLRAKYPKAAVLLTLGSDGSRYAGPEGKAEVPAVRVTAVDTTAAGDTYTGYYLSARLQGLAVGEAMQLASRASAIAVTRTGAADSIPFAEELR